MRKLLKVLRNNSGVAAMEYAGISALVGGAIIVAGGLFFGSGSGGAAGSIGWLLNGMHTALQTVIAAI